MHYIRCIWRWLLRGPSQGYHYFPYDSSIYFVTNIIINKLIWQIVSGEGPRTMPTADDGIQRCSRSLGCLFQASFTCPSNGDVSLKSPLVLGGCVARYWLSREHCIFRSHLHQCVSSSAVQVEIQRVVIGIFCYFQLRVFYGIGAWMK